MRETGDKQQDAQEDAGVGIGPEVEANPFAADPVRERFFNRSERIVLALFLVTNHVPQVETLRKSVRYSGDELIQKALSIKDASHSTVGDQISEIIATIRHLVVLVRLLMTGGFISSLNARALIEALDELGLSSQTLLTGEHTFTRTDFFPREEMLFQGRNVQKDIKETESFVQHDSLTKKTKINDVIGHIKKDTSDRVQLILGTLSTSSGLSIKEVRSQVPQFSEKMIQRELAILVLDGRVRKMGEKRWSRYSLSL